MAALAGL